MAFSTPYGHYHFKRMPFGLKNVPATFQRLMDQVLTGLQGIELFVYLDGYCNIRSLKEHEAKFNKLADRLRTARLRLQSDKCEFLRKEVTYLGHDSQERTFDQLKTALCTEPLLKYPDFTRPFIVTTDASKNAVGGILSQSEIGKDLPIAYTSRILNTAEQNYSTIERKLLAIIAEYEYEVIYKAEKINGNADALSRNPVLPVQPQKLATPHNDDSDESLYNYVNKDNPQGPGRPSVCIPLDDKESTSQESSNDCDETDIDSDSEPLIKKLVRIKPKQPMILTDTPDRAFDKIAMNIMGLLPTTSTGNSYFNHPGFTNEIFGSHPLKKNATIDVAEAFINEFICIHGASKALLTDQGSYFLNKV
ncbi:uncharacterized protein LOC105424613 [Pogonomyrmex barbatus]|uniref:Uncharacterized protein LOC105424613 n=1 Tax=Pogonomyrmex barbatus TaxID=144034 RepID=A0A6I9VXY0_9HYME|nr:uncharacterized protein LOC105424613 [Pogonomyrmex barbatus]